MISNGSLAVLLLVVIWLLLVFVRGELEQRDMQRRIKALRDEPLSDEDITLKP